MTLKTTLAALALAALSTAAYASTEAEDVTAAINNDQTQDSVSLPGMQPAAGDDTNTLTSPSDTATPTTNTTSPSISNPPSPVDRGAMNTTPNPSVTDQLQSQKMAMRRLLSDNAHYLHSYIVGDVANMHDLSDVHTRLIRNADDIAAAIKPYYTGDTGDKLTSLLHDQADDAIGITDAAKSKSQRKIDDAQAKAKTNADDIAALLSSANPNLGKDDLTMMLSQHVDAVTAEANARLKKDWKSDIDAYDRDEDNILALSDKLIDAIAKQYPEKFSSAPATIQPSSGP